MENNVFASGDLMQVITKEVLATVLKQLDSIVDAKFDDRLGEIEEIINDAVEEVLNEFDEEDNSKYDFVITAKVKRDDFGGLAVISYIEGDANVEELSRAYVTLGHKIYNYNCNELYGTTDAVLLEKIADIILH